MSDCFIDLRPAALRNPGLAAGQLRFFSDIRSFVYQDPQAALVFTRADDPALWSPYEDPETKTLVGLVGRVALEDSEWDSASSKPGNGGLACKAIYQRFYDLGLSGLHSLNGNFLVVVYAPQEESLLLVTDRCGSVLCFRSRNKDGFLLFGTHPDVLARNTGIANDLDLASLGEFLATGKISFPRTYYRGVEGIPPGTVLKLRLGAELQETTHEYFQIKFATSEATEWEMAERLAGAFRAAVGRRTNPRLGPSAVSLSGGLDSRMILCAARPDAEIKAFTFFDSKNTEFRTAQRIADEKRVEFIPMRRDPEHYGQAARLGVAILAGMGSLASNHYLGFRDAILQTGCDNLLTGCYCDYFFKGLALNRRITPWLRLEKPAAVVDQYYRPVFEFNSPVGRQVRQRMDRVLGPESRTETEEERLLDLEARRLFPILYEADSAQRGIPQRVLGWFLPIADNDILDVYLAMPVRMKLNGSVYAKAVTIVCGPGVSNIPDANTGAPVNSPQWQVAARAYLRALENRYHKYVRPKLETQGSWPNWHYYLHHSPVIRELWSSPSAEAQDVITEVLEYNPFPRKVHQFASKESEWFIRLLTLKLWFDARQA